MQWDPLYFIISNSMALIFPFFFFFGELPYAFDMPQFSLANIFDNARTMTMFYSYYNRETVAKID